MLMCRFGVVVFVVVVVVVVKRELPNAQTDKQCKTCKLRSSAEARRLTSTAAAQTKHRCKYLYKTAG